MPQTTQAQHESDNMTDHPKPPKRPCGSCPYRRDVPSGVWHAEEYAKLPRYDLETFQQPVGLFMCHQRDGCLCAGWLQTHGTDDLLALRFSPVDPSAYGYTSDVPVFESGAAAAAHGMAEIDAPGAEAQKTMRNLRRLPRLGADR